METCYGCRSLAARIEQQEAEIASVRGQVRDLTEELNLVSEQRDLVATEADKVAAQLAQRDGEVKALKDADAGYLVATRDLAAEVNKNADLQAQLRQREEDLHVMTTSQDEAMKLAGEYFDDLTTLRTLVGAVLDTWVNGRKVREGIPLELRQQIEQSLDAAPKQST